MTFEAWWKSYAAGTGTEAERIIAFAAWKAAWLAAIRTTSS